MSVRENSSRLRRVNAYGPIPDHLPSILEYYQKRLPDPLTNLSPGNAGAQLFSKKKFSENIRRSVVSVSTFQGVQRKVDCSGIIIRLGNYSTSGLILTSAMVLRFPENSYRRLYHVIVRLFNGKLLVAKECHVDYRMNIAILVVQSAQPLEALELRLVNPFRNGLDIFVFGRDFLNISLMQASGVLLTHPPRFGCDELLSSTCRTYAKSFEGGPVINDIGDIIGLNFVDDDGYAHILPTESILHALYAWRHLRGVVYPWFGITVIDKDQLSLDVLDLLNISSDDERHVFVKEVYSGSRADKLQVCPGDCVISFNGNHTVSVEMYCQEARSVSDRMSAWNAKFNFVDPQTVQIVIKRRADDEIVTVDSEVFVAENRSFCICWPFNEYVWHMAPLNGSQTDPMLISWSPSMIVGWDRASGADSSENKEE